MELEIVMDDQELKNKQDVNDSLNDKTQPSSTEFQQSENLNLDSAQKSGQMGHTDTQQSSSTGYASGGAQQPYSTGYAGGAQQPYSTGYASGAQQSYQPSSQQPGQSGYTSDSQPSYTAAITPAPNRPTGYSGGPQQSYQPGPGNLPQQTPQPGYYQTPPNYNPYGQPIKNSGKAIAGMVLGIASLAFNMFGIATAIVGLILSIMGRKEIQENPQLYKGNGMAMAGIILNIIAIGLAILLISCGGCVACMSFLE